MDRLRSPRARSNMRSGEARGCAVPPFRRPRSVVDVAGYGICVMMFRAVAISTGYVCHDGSVRNK